jgi:hypothetical protein
MRGILALLERIGAGLSAWRARRVSARFDRRLDDVVAATRCASCAAPVGHAPLRDNDVPGRYYCSLDCRNAALIRRDAELDEKMARQPAALTPEEQSLLAGKSSPGLYYEPGRCVRCGDALRESDAIFGFCSGRCEEEATRPYVTFTQQLADCDEYKKAVEDRDDFTRADSDIVAEVKQRCGRSAMADDEIRAYLDRQIKLAELQHARRRNLDRGEARVRFLTKWERQRAYVLEQEKRRRAPPREHS